MKCPLCQAKKAQRACHVTGAPICSRCCGESREKSICLDCIYYRPPVKNYRKITYYAPYEMDGYPEREAISEVIESALTTFDFEKKDSLNDLIAIRIIEMLLDVYFFKEPPQPSEDVLTQEGFNAVQDAINKSLNQVPHDELVKILGAIYFVANRRTTGKREYLDVIRRYVGVNMKNGLRARILSAFR